MASDKLGFFGPEEDEIPPEKIAILFVGGKAIECIQRLADTDTRSAPEFKTGVGKVKTADVSFILRDGTALIADNIDSKFLNNHFKNYQAVIFCPTDIADLNRYKELPYNIPDKVTRVMSSNPNIKDIVGKNLFLAQPSSEDVRIKTLGIIQSDISLLLDEVNNPKPF